VAGTNRLRQSPAGPLTAAPVTLSASILDLAQVTKSYHDADELVTAVDGVSISVSPGELTAIYGPSGSGKTTLLLLAAGLLAPDVGRVCFAGRDLATLSSAQRTLHLRHDIGFIYQSAHLMSGVPAIENAAVKLLADGLSLRRARGEAADLLERLGLASRLEHTPERLSGGERQRVAVARALVGGPRLVLADEPTGNLDSRRGLEILELFAQLAREQAVAVLLVTHDPQAATLADRVYALRDGRLLVDEDAAVLAAGAAATLHER
jgi:ABC-type lipoprotein export system ATPase subunit